MRSKYPTSVLGEDGIVYGDPGIALVDHFAIEIVKSFITAGMRSDTRQTVQVAYEWAAAMMREREKYIK